jgi:hypothetical protein
VAGEGMRNKVMYAVMLTSDYANKGLPIYLVIEAKNETDAMLNLSMMLNQRFNYLQIQKVEGV